MLGHSPSAGLRVVYALSYDKGSLVAHTVAIIGQQKAMSCWAAGLAMLRSWRNNQTVPISALLPTLGPDYNTAYTDSGLDIAHPKGALTKIGLVVEPPSNPTTQRWQDLIAKSPLFIVVDENPHPNKFAVDARLVTDIANNAAHTFTCIDPAAAALVGCSHFEFADCLRRMAGTSWSGMQTSPLLT